ncbi:uncharacterized protein LOC115073475 [Rhinatrema bivittatum]|uniref:uncharacterized protein LOC115073475 n=1 Tax=Rhinatrema bivittatum TaxID=194408 RepID=UPI0011282DA1|nr:uncharacterized protein LOC115073475 [Rhinatrema bivittatum]
MPPRKKKAPPSRAAPSPPGDEAPPPPGSSDPEEEQAEALRRRTYDVLPRDRSAGNRRETYVVCAVPEPVEDSRDGAGLGPAEPTSVSAMRPAEGKAKGRKKLIQEEERTEEHGVLEEIKPKRGRKKKNGTAMSDLPTATILSSVTTEPAVRDDLPEQKPKLANKKENGILEVSATADVVKAKKGGRKKKETVVQDPMPLDTIEGANQVEKPKRGRKKKVENVVVDPTIENKASADLPKKIQKRKEGEAKKSG